MEHKTDRPRGEGLNFYYAHYCNTRKMVDDRAVACSVSLFSGGGIGDLGVHFGSNIPVIACAELLPSRAALLRKFFPGADVYEGDIIVNKESIITGVRGRLAGRRPFLVVMSPPCQGMSSNGVGRIRSAVKKGTRSAVDERNRLVLPALDIVDALCPDVVILENVRRMNQTIILNEHGEPENAIALLHRRLTNYRVEIKIVDFADLGVPQRRIRLLGIATRDQRTVGVPLHPEFVKEQVSLAHATSHLAPLDAIENCKDLSDPFHVVPKWSEHQHFCMRHTPEGQTAFDNLMCVSCNSMNTKADVTCKSCQEVLPRPSLISRSCELCSETQRECTCVHPHIIQKRRLIRAFRTAYCRMHTDRPASTLTTNSGVISSDVKGHPRQHRVLSLREILIVASVCSYPGFDAPWWATAEPVFTELGAKEIRDVLGESIPPLALCKVVMHLLAQRKDDLDHLSKC